MYGQHLHPAAFPTQGVLPARPGETFLRQEPSRDSQNSDYLHILLTYFH